MMNNKESTIFPVDKVSILAEKESWRKEINRPIYHIHKWWAQRLGTVFRALLLHLMNDNKADEWESFYKQHDFKQHIILDPFMGSGTTIGEAVKLGAKAIGCDINPISTFLVTQALTKVPIEQLISAYNEIENDISKDILSYYKTVDPVTNKELQVLYYFWVKLVITPSGESVPLFSKYVFAQNAYASKKPKAQIVCPHCWNVFEGKYNDTVSVCSECGFSFNPQKGPANNTTVIDSHGSKYKIKDLIPKDGTLLQEKMYAILAIDDQGNKKYLPIKDYDLELYKKAQSELHKCKLALPQYEVKSGYNTDQARGYNYLSWKQFFNDRQLLCLGKLLDRILKIDNENIREQLVCLFSSTLEYNNMFCSYKGEGTGAVRPIFSNHILKPERTPLENSVWGHYKSSGCFSSLFKSRLLKAKEYLDQPFDLKIDEKNGTCDKVVVSNPIDVTMCKTWEELNSTEHSALILNGDSSKLPIPDNVVDFVVTDPPYFDFIHYSELSDFFYAWLSPVLKSKYTFFSETTSRRDNEVQQTDAMEFSRLLGNVFSECHRVLKNKGKLAFSFHHSRVDGWLAIAQAIKQAGFYIDECFPVHAELMASTPKAGAKEPISLDAMIICGKEKKEVTEDEIKEEAINYVNSMKASGKKLSKADVFVICASQCLSKLVFDNCNTDKKSECLTRVYQNVIATCEM